MKVKAFLNHGRWLVECPEDRKHYNEVSSGQVDFICLGCYPDLRSVLYRQRTDGLLEPVPDEAKREITKREAKHHEIIFPRDIPAIMELLRQRNVSEMNWLPGETLADLKAENTAHGVGSTVPDVSIIEGTVD